MKKFTLVFTLLAISLFTFAQTDVSGDVSGVWAATGNPYNVSGNITVQAVDALAIDAGVVINFQGPYSFTIIGQLDINGTLAQNVVISSSDIVVGWAGIRFISSTETSVINFADISYGNANGTSPANRGGGIYVFETNDLTINNTTITNCAATGNGGGVYLKSSDVIIDNCTISNNSAASGAGIGISSSTPTITNSVIEDNTSDFDGGGFYVSNSDVEISFTEISGNVAPWKGGGIYSFNNSEVSLRSVTITDNLGDLGGSGLSNIYNSTFNIINSIVYYNAANNIYSESDCTVNATYSDIEFASSLDYFGEGCIDEDPLFDPNYNITWINIPTPDETKSPCIDTGNPAYTDIDGTIADMGAYSFAQNGIRGTVILSGGTGDITDVLLEAELTTPPNTVYTASPDVDGNFLINVPAGIYNITASLEGYNGPANNNITVDDQIVVLPNITLTPPPSGLITGEVTLEGIGDITAVTISAGTEETNPYSVIDDFGDEYFYYILEITPSTYDVTASLTGYDIETIADVVVNPSVETPNVDFDLQLISYLGSVAGLVELVDGAGVITDVAISCDGVTTHPAADGTYLLENIPTGQQNVTASLTGYAPVTIEDVTITTNEIKADINFELLNWEIASGTIYSTTLYLTTSYDGDFLRGTSKNTQLAIFDNITDECRGIAIWVEGTHPQWGYYFSSAGYWYLTAVSNSDSGNEELRFKIYDSDNNTISTCDQSFYFPSDPSNDTNINLTMLSPIHTQTISLVENWNWISRNLGASSIAVDSAFDTIEGDALLSTDLRITSQENSSIFYPQDIPDIPVATWIGSLDNLLSDAGYKILVPADYPNFTFTGSKINPITHPINIANGYDVATNNNGYNWISFYPYQELDINTALQSLAIPDSSIIKNQTQSAVYYGNWIGDLTTLTPGSAYLFKWHAAIGVDDVINLVYPPIDSRAIIEPAYKPQANWAVAGGNEDNMIVMAEIAGNQNISVGLFDADGICHSIGKPVNNFWYFTVTESSSELYFRKINNNSRIGVESSNSILFRADAVIGDPRNPVKVDFREENDVVDLPAVLEQNTPNPFNPSTTIRFQLANSSRTTLEIYNCKGQKVKTLVDADLAAGAHHAVWNGKDDSRKSVVSGVYFYRLINGNFQQTNKMLLIK